MDAPIPRDDEQRLQRPLHPREYEPVAAPRRRGRRRQEIQDEFDPNPPLRNRAITNNLNEFRMVFRPHIEGGVEEKTGCRYITWYLSQDLEKNRTPFIMRKFRERTTTAFYIRYIYGIIIWNIEDGTLMLHYTKKRFPLDEHVC